MITYDDANPRAYINHWAGIDFRKEPLRYKVGRGEQGVLLAEPYKSEILPNWRFRTPEIARESAELIYRQFLDYLDSGDFPGADMARKFLQMGVTRARRYANHASGRKYASDGSVLPLESDRWTSSKAQSAEIFGDFYRRAEYNEAYRDWKKEWKNEFG
jgi:hypothetical protein